MITDITNKKCETTHSYQGNETDRTVVILYSGSGTWGLNGRTSYLISALTRCK